MTEAQLGRFSQFFIDRPNDQSSVETLLGRVETSLSELDVANDQDVAWYIGEALRISTREKMDYITKLLVQLNAQIPFRFVLEYMETQRNQIKS